MLRSSFLCLTILASQCQGQHGPVDQDCLNLLPENYKKYKSPLYQGKPINVSLSLEILNLDEINEGNMDFRLHVYVHKLWIDERLNSNATPIRNSRCYDHLWTPDVVYEEAKTLQTFGKNNHFFDITKEKQIYSVERYAFKVGCLMYFNNFPFDTQHCVFTLSLISNSDEDAHIFWSDDELHPAIQLVKKIEPLQFYFRRPTVDARREVFNGIGFTTLQANITLIRRLTGSIVNIYAPSTLIVAVSWVTFWLRPEAAPARVALSITSLLTLCTQAQQHKSQLPPLNYITAVDIWLFVCILMVFSSLVEFAICYNAYMTKKVKETQDLEPTKSYRTKTKHNSWTVPKSQDIQSEKKSKTSEQRNRNKCFGCSWSNEIAGIDVICRKLFPLSFLTFAIVYWVHYLKVYKNP